MTKSVLFASTFGIRIYAMKKNLIYIIAVFTIYCNRKAIGNKSGANEACSGKFSQQDIVGGSINGKTNVEGNLSSVWQHLQQVSDDQTPQIVQTKRTKFRDVISRPKSAENRNLSSYG